MTFRFPMSRRRFLAASSTAAAAAAFAPDAGASARPRGPAGHGILVPRAGRWMDVDPHALAAAAVDAARAAGAAYADVRLTRRMDEWWTSPHPETWPFARTEMFGVGVRALVDGFWGFLGSSLWTPEEMVRLARGAVAQGKQNSLGKPRDLSLAPTPIVRGEWTTPIKYDPFQIPYAEKFDFFNHVIGEAHRRGPLYSASMNGDFTREESVFASSEGSTWAQTRYLAQGGIGLECEDQAGDRQFYSGHSLYQPLSAGGAGWEYFSESGVVDAIPQLLEEAAQMRDPVPVDVGRFDIVCTAQAVAHVLGMSIGPATELDRAMGYEADAGGTSYLDRPLEMLGTQVVGTPALTVTANRSQPGGCATVKWDDEGVEPDEFTLVKNGVLVDYQTTREQAEWLAPYYKSAGKPMRSHGCACAGAGNQYPMANLPNFQIHPSAGSASFEELVAGTAKGVAVIHLTWMLSDPQYLNGTTSGVFREIRNGKLGRAIAGAGLAFRAPEFWKSLDALGGAASLRWYGYSVAKGQPQQKTYHSVGAVPARFKNAAIIDYARKA